MTLVASYSTAQRFTVGQRDYARRLGDRVELFADGFDLHDKGWNYATRPPGFRDETHANAAGNLFANSVYFYFPVPGLASRARSGGGDLLHQVLHLAALRIRRRK